MRVLQIVDWAVLAVGAFSALSMAVVSLAIWVHKVRATELGVALQPLLLMTAALSGLAVMAAGAVAALRFRSHWHWPLQGLIAGMVVFITLLSRALA